MVDLFGNEIEEKSYENVESEHGIKVGGEKDVKCIDCGFRFVNECHKLSLLFKCKINVLESYTCKYAIKKG